MQRPVVGREGECYVCGTERKSGGWVRREAGGDQGRIGLGWSGAQTYSSLETRRGLSDLDGALFIPDHQSLAFQFFS